MEKMSVSGAIANFQKRRKDRRPHRVHNLLKKTSLADSPWATTESMSAQPEKLAAVLGGDEFSNAVYKHASKKEFAPGIPASRSREPIPPVAPKAANQQWDLSLSMHPAERRGDHVDLRLVDPKGKAHSWAIPVQIPAPGKSAFAVQQPTHTKEYALRDKPFEIPTGYGKTRPGANVEPIHVGKVEVVEAGPDKIRFLRHLGQNTEEFVLRRIDTPGVGAPIWAFHNATKSINTQEGKRIPLYKRDYKKIDPESVNLDDPNQVLTAKIDGAHTITHLMGEDRHLRVYSYRPSTRNPAGLIEHTHKLPNFQKLTTPPDLKGTVLRTELWFSKDGKAVPVSQIGGILNSNTIKAREKQRGLKPRLTVLDVVRHGGKKYEDKPFSAKLPIMKDVVKRVRILELPPMATEPDEKKRLFEAIKSRRHPMTQEGVVLRDITDKTDKPIKVVFRPDHDVYVREVFKKERGAARGHAGGFAFSWTPDGPIVGRVGTGFDHATRKDMLENPDRYIGRVAKVRSMDVHQNKQDPSQIGALRAPSFIGWHLDKNDPAQMSKEAGIGRTIDRWLHPKKYHGDILDPSYQAKQVVKTVEDVAPMSRKWRGFLAAKRELLSGSEKTGADRGYGHGGKWIHDRAHRIMEQGDLSRYGGNSKQVAYALATQQAHALKKSPKDFRTQRGVQDAKAKYDSPKEMKKTAWSEPLTKEAAAKLMRRGKVVKKGELTTSAPMNPAGSGTW